ncbi:hypothetical protein VNI00_010630 [Paramarasmius palmivorus]|uniref:FAD-binding PCMH-type domain-containing protein n=1 Tax=Paramarasmius palmivorus TaxID=297713 RepID=A0AAW0CKK0_9AGAR
MKVSKHPVLLVTLLAVDAVRCSSTAACNALQEALPGLVFFPGTEEYVDDNLHYTRGVSENSTCSVEPGTTDDVGTILRIVGSGETRSSFGVKGGGHTGNLGFSSTPGVQISLSKFTDLTFDNASSTVRLGAGLFWDEVYERLEPFGVKVIGGRVPGVGVSGLSLGGGYSYFTDQFGLTIDNIVSHDLVLPNGTFIEVTESSDPDLFFALKASTEECC